MTGGRKFADVRELKHVLGSSAARKFTRCLTENLLTYGLGRGLQPLDYCTVEEIRVRLAADNYKIQDILFGIVESRAFQHRGGAK